MQYPMQIRLSFIFAQCMLCRIPYAYGVLTCLYVCICMHFLLFSAEVGCLRRLKQNFFIFRLKKIYSRSRKYIPNILIPNRSSHVREPVYIATSILELTGAREIWNVGPPPVSDNR